MRYALLAIAMLAITPAWSQFDKEFEGVIKYQHKFHFKASVVDSLKIINALGTSSVFYYKNGNYKWVVNSDSNSKIEYFDFKTQTVYTLYGENDTFYISRKNGYDDSLVLFKLNDTGDIVCGIRCKKVETISINRDDPDFQTKRILYYSPTVSIRPDRFSNYRTYATNEVIKKIKCWPIKIELESKLMPFTFILEAIEINPNKLSDSEVYLPPKKPIKLLPLF